LFSQANSLAALGGVLSGALIALYLGDDPARYRPAVLALAVLLLGGALASLRTPSRPLQSPGRNPLAVLALLWRHGQFGAMSLTWMLVGFGNLSTLPLRTEFIASGDFGPEYPARVVLVITVVLPQAVALVTTLGWGRLFDRVSFPMLRLAINSFFAASILVYFGPSLTHQVLGSLLLGIGQGGGLVTWNLWVTKYAPPRRTADYMAVHTFLTGVRGLVAPIFAYRVLAVLPLLTVTRIGVALNLVACVVLVGIILSARRAAFR
jgi:MFS family permease